MRRFHVHQKTFAHLERTPKVDEVRKLTARTAESLEADVDRFNV